SRALLPVLHFVRHPTRIHRTNLRNRLQNPMGTNQQSQRYCWSSGANSRFVFDGQRFLPVMTAFCNAWWHEQPGCFGMWGRASHTIALAVAAFLFKLAMTISTVTCASSVFQQS